MPGEPGYVVPVCELNCDFFFSSAAAFQSVGKSRASLSALILSQELGRAKCLFLQHRIGKAYSQI